VLHTGRPSYTGGIGRRIMARGWENTQDPIWKITQAKRAEGTAQVVECLPRKCWALSSKPQYHQKKKSASFIFT
jgi:hypothetical protein